MYYARPPEHVRGPCVIDARRRTRAEAASEKDPNAQLRAAEPPRTRQRKRGWARLRQAA